MDYIPSESAGFNRAPPTFMHIDLNSCFATVEQQAQIHLRGKPVAVAAYVSDGGCILAASVEAKRKGVKTGLRVREGKALCPELIVLPPDPDKYRYINKKLLSLFSRYSSDVEVRSIDEMIINFQHAPVLERVLSHAHFPLAPETKYSDSMVFIGNEIKQKIKEEVGEWLTVSVGISTNRYLAKVASGLHKPDGLDVITSENIEEVLKAMELEELTGIKKGFGGRLRQYGISSAIAFYRTPIRVCKGAFRSVIGYHWWLRLHGWEADDRIFDRKSFGHSHALYVPHRTNDPKLHQILWQLVIKMGRRLRKHGFAAGGIHVSCLYGDYSFWHKGQTISQPLYADSDLYREALRLLVKAPEKGVKNLAVCCFFLQDGQREQMEFWTDTEKKRSVVRAVDAIDDRWGEFTVVPARMLVGERKVLDRIAFGNPL